MQYTLKYNLIQIKGEKVIKHGMNYGKKLFLQSTIYICEIRKKRKKSIVPG